MVVLDTDYLTLLEWPEHPKAQTIRDRLSRLSEAEVATTIVNYEEKMRGWLASIKKAKSMSEQVEKYRQLKRMVELYQTMNLLSFDDLAAIEFQRLKKSIRVGTMDLKVAAIALANNATLLTRNLQHFRQIPRLTAEDWTQR